MTDIPNWDSKQNPANDHADENQTNTSANTDTVTAKTAPTSVIANGPVVLELQNAAKTFVVGESVIEAVRGVSLTVSAGEFVIILGTSGSGKSTTLGLIAGLERLSRGEILIDGFPISEMSEDELTELRRKKIGIVFQFFELHEGLTAAENVDLPMLITGSSYEVRSQRITALLESVNMSHRAGNLPHELSGGEKQRIGIARSLANNPELLLADEPIGDLDSAAGNAVIDLLMKLNQTQGVTVIMVTHDLDAVRPGMRVVKLDSGRLIDDYIYTHEMDKDFRESLPSMKDDYDQEEEEAKDISMGIVVNPEGKDLCPDCGRIVTPDDAFCAKCGNRLRAK